MSKAHLTKVKEKNVSQFLNNKGTLVIVEFNARRCAGCKRMAPVSENSSQSYAQKTIIENLDIDDIPGKTKEYSVTAIPAMLFFKNGKL